MTKTVFVLVIALSLSAIQTPQAAQVLFTPTLFISEEYTDNVDLDPENEVEDYITRAGLILNGQILGHTAGLELNYSPSYNKYRDNEDYDSWRHEASLYTWKEIKRHTRLELRNTYLHSNDPSDESEAIDADDPTQGSAIETDTNRRGRNEYYTNNAEARISHQFGSDDSFYLACQYRLLRDEDIPAGELVDDNDIWTSSIGLIYNFTTRGGIEMDASYASTDYEDENQNDRDEFNGNIRFLYNFSRRFSGFIAYSHTTLVYDQDNDEDYQIYRPSVGIDINFQDNAGISIGAGYYIQDFEISENEEGFNVDSEFFKRWEYRLGYFGIAGSSGYEIDDDGSEDNGLTIYYEGRVDAGYRFTSSLSSNIYGAYRYTEYPNETPERVERTVEAGAGLDWQALQWMTIGLSYNHSDVISDDPTNEYTENRAMITIRMTPSSPFRLN